MGLKNVTPAEAGSEYVYDSGWKTKTGTGVALQDVEYVNTTGKTLMALCEMVSLINDPNYYFPQIVMADGTTGPNYASTLKVQWPTANANNEYYTAGDNSDGYYSLASISAARGPWIIIPIGATVRFDAPTQFITTMSKSYRLTVKEFDTREYFIPIWER